MIIRKKAISPLIATVLLIAFTITIASLISNFYTTFVSTQQASGTEKTMATLNCAYSKLKINSMSYNGTSNILKTRITNDGAQDSALANITFSVIMRDGSSSIYNTASGGSDTILYTGETDYYSNASVIGGCNITAVYVSSDCPNAKESITSSGIDFTGC